MSTILFARIANGAVAELIPLPETMDPAKMFAPDIVLVNVSAVSPTPVVGNLAVQTNGAWAFSSAPTPPPPAPIVPASITIFQAKAALLHAPGAQTGKTLLDDVTAWVATQSALVQLAWAEAGVVNRNGVFVGQAATALGWTAAQVDALFIAGAKIVV